MILVSKDTKGKIRVVGIDYEWNDEQHGFIISRTTWQLGGKLTYQPKIIIQRGKAGRTLTEQCELEYNSRIKKYLDKGYKELPNRLDIFNITDDTMEALNELLGDNKTGQDGMLKPMLAKQADKVANSVFNKEYYGSRKINGVRCLIYKDINGELRTSSRGSINYDLAIYHILDNPIVKEFFDKHPEAILDGEIYKHGLPLNEISGMCRHQETISSTSELEFYWYDIVDLEKTFEERWELMNEWAKELHIDFHFDPYYHYDHSMNEVQIKLLPQRKMSGWASMLKYHNQYVNEGWEGLVIRRTDALYGPGKRTNDMIKIKVYKEDTFRCVGIEQGLRKYDDMCFVMETKEGKTFKAKPYGDRNQKIEYTDNFDKVYKGHLGDVKFFDISPYGIPEQPNFIAFRWDLE